MTALLLAGCRSGTVAPGDYCNQALFIDHIQLRLEKMDPSDMRSVVAELRELSAEVNSITAVAPEAIKSDWERMNTVIGNIASSFAAYEDVDLSNPSGIDEKTMEGLAGLEDKIEVLDHAEMLSLGDTIDKFTESECGFTLGFEDVRAEPRSR
jgi:hypothetical protein